MEQALLLVMRCQRPDGQGKCRGEGGLQIFYTDARNFPLAYVSVLVPVARNGELDNDVFEQLSCWDMLAGPANWSSDRHGVSIVTGNFLAYLQRVRRVDYRSMQAFAENVGYCQTTLAGRTACNAKTRA